MISRRQFIRQASAIGGATLLIPWWAAACGDSGGEQATISTQLIWFTDITYVGWYVGDNEGYYADENITSDLLAGGPNLANIEAVVAGGAATVGMSDVLGVANANAQGGDFVMFAAQFQKSPGGLLSLASNPVRSAEDIVGKRIGGGPGSEVRVDAVLNANGLPLDYEQVRTVEAQGLLDGLIDALATFIIAPPVPVIEAGEEYEVVSFSEMGLLEYADVLFTTRRRSDEQHDELVRYLRATVKGWEKDFQDPEAGTELTMELYGEELGLEYDFQHTEHLLLLPLMESDLTREKGLMWVSEEEVAGPIYDALRATGAENLPDPLSIIDTSILEDAFGGETSLLG